MLTTELIVANSFEAIRGIRPWLEEALAPAGEARVSAAIGGIELAVHEIATNSIDHANNAEDTLRFVAETAAESVTIRMIDHGDCYVTQEPLPLDGEPRVRGYGLLIVEQLATSVEHERVEQTNVWTLTFAL